LKSPTKKEGYLKSPFLEAAAGGLQRGSTASRPTDCKKACPGRTNNPASPEFATNEEMMKAITLGLALLIAGFCLPATSKAGGPPDLNGIWIGYYNDGKKSEYTWAIHQTDLTLSIENVGGKKAKSAGRIDGDKIFAQDFATQNGTLSDDGTKITWTDGVVWKKKLAADLNGTWVGYYEDGTKSEYTWSIRQTGSTLSIENVGGETAKSRGRVDGDKVIAEDFATNNGKLSADGTKITWSDGVVWKRQ
jgi:hypothetical protein